VLVAARRAGVTGGEFTPWPPQSKIQNPKSKIEAPAAAGTIGTVGIIAASFCHVGDHGLTFC